MTDRPSPSGAEGLARPDGRRTGTAAIRLATAVVLVLALLAGPAAPGVAQDEDESSLAITLSELTGVLGPGSRPPPEPGSDEEMGRVPMDLDLRVLVENDGDVPLSDLTLVIEVHAPAAGRVELRRALAGELGSADTAVRSVPLLEGRRLQPGEITGVMHTIDREELGSSEGGGVVRPVRIAVVRGLEVLDEVITPVVWLSTVPQRPLAATMVWPYDAPPLRTSGGAYLAGVDREVRPGGRLDVLLRTLERSDDPLVTFAPAPHLLEDLADRADGFVSFERNDEGVLESRPVGAAGSQARLADGTLHRVRELAGSLPLSPLASTYASADLAALHDAGGAAAELAANAAVDGRRRLQRQLGRDIAAASHLLQGPVDPSVLDLVPGETVLVPSEVTAEPPVEATNPSPVRSLRAPSGRLVTVVVADPDLEDALAEIDHPAGPVAATQRIIGQSAMAYLENPGAADRALLLLPPANWDPPPRAASRLVDELASATWLELVSPDELVRGGATAGVAFAEPELGAFSDDFAASLDTAAVSLTAAAAALPEGETRLNGRSFAELEDSLLRASSRWLRGTNEAEAEALVRDVQRTADETFGDVEVATGPVTLTSDTGQIPVTLQRTRGEAIMVSVEVASPGRLVWTETRRSVEPVELQPGGSHTVSFPVRALATGTFPVTVRVTDPSGVHELGRSSMTVRSTAISGAALSLIGLAILILLLLGALRRPGRKPRLEVVP